MFCVATLRLVVVIEIGPAGGPSGAIENDSGTLAVTAGLPESATVTVALKVPPAAGVPAITPVAALIAIPGGSEPAVILQL